MSRLGRVKEKVTEAGISAARFVKQNPAGVAAVSLVGTAATVVYLAGCGQKDCEKYTTEMVQALAKFANEHSQVAFNAAAASAAAVTAYGLKGAHALYSRCRKNAPAEAADLAAPINQAPDETTRLTVTPTTKQ